MGQQFALDVGPLSDPGQMRDLNEDDWGTFEQMGKVVGFSTKNMERKGRLYAVADGMGGHAAGEVASKKAIGVLFRQYYTDPNPDLLHSLKRAFEAANAEIHTQAKTNFEQSGMGTTLVAAVIKGDRLLVANVGDSRAYLIREQWIQQISKDHSWVGEQVEAGLLTEKEARQHVYRNIITRSLGNRPEVEVDVFSQTIYPGDAIVLCSDGLSNEVHEDEIERIVSANDSQGAAKALIDLANKRGGLDNITTVVIKVGEGIREPLSPRQILMIGGVGVVILIAAIIRLWLGFPTIFSFENVETMIKTITEWVVPEPRPTPVTPTFTPTPTVTLMPTTSSIDTPAATPTSAPSETSTPMAIITSTPPSAPTGTSTPTRRLRVPWRP